MQTVLKLFPVQKATLIWYSISHIMIWPELCFLILSSQISHSVNPKLFCLCIIYLPTQFKLFARSTFVSYVMILFVFDKSSYIYLNPFIVMAKAKSRSDIDFIILFSTNNDLSENTSHFNYVSKPTSLIWAWLNSAIHRYVVTEIAHQLLRDNRSKMRDRLVSGKAS